MDLASDKTLATGRPIELIIAYGHRAKLHRINSKDKLNNAVLKNANEHEKKSISKLPKVKKAPLYPHTAKNTLDNSGESLAGPSKPKPLPQRTRRPSLRYEADKLKPSQIPRRKEGVASPTLKHNERKPDNNYFVSDTQHIQRLQVPNIPDFHQEERIPTTSIGSTRPIPTLGQIYRHQNNVIIDGDRFYDWFMELDAPVNSLESNPRNIQRASTDSTDTAQSVINFEVKKACFGESEKPKVVLGANVYKTTNDNIADWLSNELEYSNKDNESGYRSMSPHSRGVINIESKDSDENVKQSSDKYCLGLEKTIEDSNSSEKEGASNENNIWEPFEKVAFEPRVTTVIDMPLMEQPTVVISRIPDKNETESIQTELNVNNSDKGLGPIVILKSELSKIFQFPSVMGPDSKEEKTLAPSYVECPSEILQRTTNFEGDGMESPKTLSSLACTDLEIRDNYSSLYTLDNVDDYNLDEHTNSALCPGCRSDSCMTFVKSGESDKTSQQNSYPDSQGVKSDRTIVPIVDSDSRVNRDNTKYCRLCGRRNSPVRHGDVRKYCKKHSRYRRFPSNRYRITIPFDSWRRRLYITRVCRHRWNRVWKKAAGRWNNRSRSHPKLGKYKMLEYLQSSINWEDVDVQTLTIAHREAGTHTNEMQKKSAGISASIKKSTSAKKTDTERKSMPPKIVEDGSKIVHKYFSYPENRNKNVEAVESKRNSKVICMCEDTLQTINASTSPINFHKLRTMEHNSGVTILNPRDDSVTSTYTPMKIPKEYRPADACTQVLLTFNNIETDISFAPIFVDHSAGKLSGDIPFYKPSGINTGPTASKPTPVEKASVKISTSVHVIDHAMKSDLSTETAPPCLRCTEAKIVSISSAQMLPAAVFTSHTDLPPTGAPRNPVSTISCQCDTIPSLTCRCNDDAKVVCTAVLQLSKSTAAQETETEDRSIGSTSNSQRFLQEKNTSTHGIDTGPSSNSQISVSEKTTSTLNNDTDIKQTRNLSTQALINQWCQSQMFVDTGTTPAALVKKSTYVFTSAGQRSAYALTSVNKRPSNDLVKTNGFPILQCASVSTNTSFSVGRRSVGQSIPDVLTEKSQQKPTIDTWVQYSHILEQNGHHSFRSAQIGNSKLISAQPLNASSIGTVTTNRQLCYDNGTEPILPAAFPKSSIAVMTSGPFDEASDTTELKKDPHSLLCSCARVGCNIETNTHSSLKLKQNRECSTQIFQSKCNQNIDKSSSCGDNGNTTMNFSTYNQRSTAEQLTTLSRLIGNPKSSHLTSDTSTALSSNLDAAKWIKRCAKDDKEYQSILDTEQSTLETLKQASLYIANSSKSSKSTKKSLKIESKSKPSDICSLNTVSVATPPPPTGTLSDDSLADVLPITSVTKKISIPNETKKMTDQATSDELISKHLKESILQTCPDINHAATDTMLSSVDYVKSASALTSRCVLPAPSICSQSNENSECVFVYDKPYCAVHKQRIDASVQMSVKHYYVNNDKDSKSREHAIDQMEGDVFSPKTPSHEQGRTNKSVVAEVLSPKVYKALYETTKMVVKDSKLHSVGDTVMNSVHDKAFTFSAVDMYIQNTKSRQHMTLALAVKEILDASLVNEAALIRALAIRSAGILTSRCGLSPSDNCQCKLKTDPTVKRAEYVFAFDTPQPSEDLTQTCSNCHARLLEIPPYLNADFVEERMKTQLVGSCRYYSNLLTKRFGRVKEKVTKHLAPPTEQCMYCSTVPKLSYTEACTMKPSGREDLGIQTARNHVPSRKPGLSKHLSCCALSPSLTNICSGTDENHLKSVYYMLSAIEGRIRRLKSNIPD